MNSGKGLTIPVFVLLLVLLFMSSKNSLADFKWLTMAEQYVKAENAISGRLSASQKTEIVPGLEYAIWTFEVVKQYKGKVEAIEREGKPLRIVVVGQTKHTWDCPKPVEFEKGKLYLLFLEKGRTRYLYTMVTDWQGSYKLPESADPEVIRKIKEEVKALEAEVAVAEKRKEAREAAKSKEYPKTGIKKVDENTDDEYTFLKKKVARLEEEIYTMKRKNRDTLAEKESRVRQLHERTYPHRHYPHYRTIPLKTDGAIITVDSDKKRITVNLGKKENLYPGMKFDVFRTKNYEDIRMGRIEIRDVQETISVGHIIESSGSLFNGDKISSPLIEKGKTMTYFIAGDFEKYTNADLKKKVKAIGGKVVEKIDSNTDYVIIGVKNIGYARSDAIENQVLTMNEWDLSKYLPD